MHITVLGATGLTGAHLLDLALARGIEVTALVRDPAKLTVNDRRLRVVPGDATDADAVARALQRSDAVVSALGAGRSRTSDIASRAAVAVRLAAERTGVERVIWLSALGVGDSRADGSGVQRLIWRLVMGQVFQDKAIGDRTIAESGLRYTLVYPTTLSNKPTTGPCTAAAHLDTTKSVSRAAVAAFMLDQLTTDEWANATVEVAG